ncbi:hypothetical protein [Bartonella sp. DGB1]|uniref:hypothetical protein n=1 Tax=Bartonella sp. DGB1 TaxID=3239807 RepID=UPI003525233B
MQNFLVAFNLVKKYIFICTVCLFFVPINPYATSIINISGKNIAPIRIAIPTIASVDDSGAEIYKLIFNNLTKTNMVSFVPANKIENLSINKEPNFNLWKTIDAQLLTVISVDYFEQDKYQINVRIWDVYRNKQLDARQLTVAKAGVHHVAHIISDMLYTKIFSLKSNFDSRIAYIENQGTVYEPKNKIVIMDQDGNNICYLPTSEDLIVSPKLSPKHNFITYFKFVNNIAKLYSLDLQNGQEELLLDDYGIGFSQAISSDNQRMLVSIFDEWNGSNIYELDLLTKRKRQLTFSIYNDISPFYSPDGKYIVFSSDLNGGQDLYVMNSHGKGLTRISKNAGEYFKPVWSPNGDLIAFIYKNDINIALATMKPNGTAMKILSIAEHIDGASFSPNGQEIIFTKWLDGTPHLYKIDISGHNETLINTPNVAQDADWSYYLH